MSTVYVLTPLTDKANAWIDERISDDARWFAGGVVIEHRYVDDIMMGIEVDGLEEEFSLRS